MPQLDYYKVLGVEHDASLTDIKNAYRRLAMKYHPDKSKGDKENEKHFKEINEAFSVLGDKEKREKYDAFGHQGINGGGPGGQWSGDFSNFSDLGGIFESVFGGGQNPFGQAFRSRERRQSRTPDMQYKIDIPFEEAYDGSTKEITVKVQENCKDCKGNGAKDGTAIKDCLRCGGSGVMISSSGFMQVQQTCNECRGSGKIIEEECPNCHGGGTIGKDKKIEFKVPAGINDGDKVVLRGEATHGDLTPGDIYIWVNVKPHSLYDRDGADLHCYMPVDVFDAILGCEIELPTMKGKVSVKIPPGTQNDKMLRLRGEGMPRLNSSQHGDILVVIKVETPVNLSKKQTEMIRKLGDGMDADDINHSPDTSNWKDKIKSFFK